MANQLEYGPPMDPSQFDYSQSTRPPGSSSRGAEFGNVMDGLHSRGFMGESSLPKIELVDEPVVTGPGNVMLQADCTFNAFAAMSLKEPAMRHVSPECVPASAIAPFGYECRRGKCKWFHIQKG